MLNREVSLSHELFMNRNTGVWRDTPAIDIISIIIFLFLATPGRLNDLQMNDIIDLKSITYLVCMDVHILKLALRYCCIAINCSHVPSVCVCTYVGSG